MASKSTISDVGVLANGILGTLLLENKKILTILDSLSLIDQFLGIEFTKVGGEIFVGKKILIVEDTMFFAKQLIQTLTPMGAQVVHAENGELGFLKVQQEHFDLIISDIEMPKMNGFELASKIKNHEKYKHIPMIAVTTRFRDVDRQKGLSVGFNTYLEKLNRDEIRQTVASYLGGKG